MNAEILMCCAATGGGVAILGAYALRPRISLFEHRMESLLPRRDLPGTTPTRSQVLDRCGAQINRLLGGAQDVAARLERAGLPPNVEAFRSRQALWAIGSLTTAAGVIALSSLQNPPSPATAVALLTMAVVCAVIGQDQLLTHKAKRREAQMLAEFPAVADMLALAVAAGQGPLGAIEHVTNLCHGPLSNELARALDEARTGTGLTDALAGVARRTSVTAITRFVDGTIVALERGTPLADVLRGQAQDARDTARGELIEQAGRKEVLMMVPVVFFILPITIIFAVFPGLSSLNLSL